MAPGSEGRAGVDVSGLLGPQRSSQVSQVSQVCQLGVAISVVNRTRFKENILSHVSELSEFRSGREVLFSFDKEVGPLLSKVCSYSDAIQIEKTAFLLSQGKWCSVKTNTCKSLPRSHLSKLFSLWPFDFCDIMSKRFTAGVFEKKVKEKDCFSSFPYSYAFERNRESMEEELRTIERA